MSLTTAQLLQFFLAALLVILLPGPNSLFVMTTAAKVGKAAAWRAAAGVFVGDSCLMLAAVLGAGTLMSGGSWTFRIIASAGALYLGWMALGLLRRALEISREPRADDDAPPTAATMADAHHAPFKRALAASLLNPKAILFFAAFFVQFIKPGAEHMWANFLVLGGILQLISMTYLSTVIVISSRLGHRVSGNRAAAVTAHALAGVVFVLFALKLASASVTGA